jgi:hypothetical protein
MKTQEKDLYHGTALTQVVEHESFKALNKATTKYGHYQINHDRRLIVKYTKGSSSPWSFTFQKKDVKVVSDDISAGHSTYICLVCGDETICALNEEQILQVIDLDGGTQWIKVEMPPKSSLRVKGSNGELSKTVPNNSFPKKLFQ